MSRLQYTYEDIHKQLREILTRTQTFSVFGKIGSRNVRNDLDIITIKKPHAHAREYLQDIHATIDELDEYMEQEYDRKVVRFNRFSHEDTVKYIADFQPGDLALHMMNYRSIPELEQIWRAYMTAQTVPRNILTDPKYNFQTIHGTLEQALQNTSQLSHSGIYQYIDRRDRTNSQFPKELETNSHNELFHYLSKQLNTERFRATNRQGSSDAVADNPGWHDCPPTGERPPSRRRRGGKKR